MQNESQRSFKDAIYVKNKTQKSRIEHEEAETR